MSVACASKYDTSKTRDQLLSHFTMRISGEKGWAGTSRNDCQLVYSSVQYISGKPERSIKIKSANKILFSVNRADKKMKMARVLIEEERKCENSRQTTPNG